MTLNQCAVTCSLAVALLIPAPLPVSELGDPLPAVSICTSTAPAWCQSLELEAFGRPPASRTSATAAAGAARPRPAELGVPRRCCASQARPGRAGPVPVPGHVRIDQPPPGATRGPPPPAFRWRARLTDRQRAAAADPPSSEQCRRTTEANSTSAWHDTTLGCT